MIDIYDLTQFAPAFLKIADKSGNIVPFQFNRAQLYVHQKLEEQQKVLGYVRALILKGRQQGVSTLIQARFFHRILTVKGTQAFILTHMSDATQSLFDITKRYNDNLPDGLAPAPSQKSHNRLTYNKLGSGYRVGTAGSKSVGRSMTNQLLHMSEAAFYEHVTELAQGIEQTVADQPGTEKIKESTANGVANSFYNAWQAAESGESEYIAIFVPWYWQDEYTKPVPDEFAITEAEQDLLDCYGNDGLKLEHLVWRRSKISDFDGTPEEKVRKFQQEYPFTAEEAFQNSITDTFITPDLVRPARKNTVESSVGMVVGVDVARFGNDLSAIIRRKGREAYQLETFANLNTMELAAKIRRIIDNERPIKVFIDSIGIGAGVVDRLMELGYHDVVVGVNVSYSSDEPDRFKNLRAQLWHECKQWFMEPMGVSIPDDITLQNELCSLGYHYDTQQRLTIESKEAAKKRGVKSPDKAEALILTFADGQMPQSSGTYYNPKSARAAAGWT